LFCDWRKSATLGAAFDKFVPCLARYEEHVIRECKREMNASISSVQQLQHVVATRGPIGTISMIPSMLQNVCKSVAAKF